MSALILTPSSRWTIWKSTRWRWTACTCSTTQTWSLLTRPQRKRFALTGSNNRCVGVVASGREHGFASVRIKNLETSSGKSRDSTPTDHNQTPEESFLKKENRSLLEDTLFLETSASPPSLQDQKTLYDWSYGMNYVHGSVTIFLESMKCWVVLNARFSFEAA